MVSMMGICCDKRSCFLYFIKLKGGNMRGNKVVLRAVGMYS